jgi:hypothetical protein
MPAAYRAFVLINYCRFPAKLSPSSDAVLTLELENATWQRRSVVVVFVFPEAVPSIADPCDRELLDRRFPPAGIAARDKLIPS